MEAKVSAIAELEAAKTKAEEELVAARESLEKMQSDQSDGSTQLGAIRAEVSSLNASF